MHIHIALQLLGTILLSMYLQLGKDLMPQTQINEKLTWKDLEAARVYVDV